MGGKSGTTVAVRLRASVAGHPAALVAETGGTTSVFRGAVDLDDTLKGFLAELCESFASIDPSITPDLFDALTPGLDLAVTRLAVRYDPGSSTPPGEPSWSLAAACELTVGEQLLKGEVFFANIDPAHHVIGLTLPGRFTLDQAPLFGPILSAIAIAQPSVLYASGNLAVSTEVVLPSAAAGGVDYILPLKRAVEQGLSAAFALESAGATQPVDLQVSGPRPMLATRQQADSAPPAKAPAIKWVQVQKTLGPLTIQQVGAGWMDGVALLLDSSVQFAGLSLGLKAFSVAFPISMFLHPSFSDLHIGLGGLSLAYTAGPTTISGAFLRVPPPAGTSGSPDYEGQALISVARFTLSAMGAYGNDQQGNPSLFVFAMLKTILGGPPYFFVTGVAAGFGYNRSLRLPTLDGLPSFPLVAGAVATTAGQNPFTSAQTPGAALSVLHDYISPDSGQNWLAAGVRFTSFEMVQSFALLTVAFGAQTEIGVLGLSTLTVPTGAESPIGFAEMALKATFRPDTGLLAIGAKLTAASYILSRDCHLTGGFAFYVWFKDSADGTVAAGDFVVTLGGYHPRFVKPPNYPDEPRVGANWQVDGNLTVKGEFYFALTPAAVMGGGALSATWSSGDLRAWFDLDADFLLSWKPFHYEASLDLSLGASYRLNLLFTTTTVTVHLGVHLELWGPPFAGTAHVDLYVVSFTIAFGGDRPATSPIGWQDFAASFLPRPNATSSLLGGAPVLPTVCYSRVASGLIRDISKDPDADGLSWVLDPASFELVTVSSVPSKAAFLVTGNGDRQHPAPKSITVTPGVPAWTTAFGVGPVAIADADLVSEHTITVLQTVRDLTGQTWRDNDEYDFSAQTQCVPVLANVPRAAWSSAAAFPPPSIEDISGKPRTIVNALVGCSLRPNVKRPDQTTAMDLDILQFTLDPVTVPFDWARPDVPTTDPFAQASSLETLKQTIAADPVRAQRAAIITALQHQSVPLAGAVSIASLNTDTALVLLSGPVLSYLGEARSR